MTHSDLTEIVRKRLFSLGAEPGDRCLVALSGGQDSTALLLAARAGWGSGVLTAAAHLDHAVRRESASEQLIVKSLCAQLGVEIRTGRLDPEKVWQKAKEVGSLEAAMRIYRYEFLISSLESMEAKWLLTGHTADDQVETVLFRVFRGMTPMALSGIPDRRGRIIRPLLSTGRGAAFKYCMDLGIKPLDDPSNRDYRFARNRIRYRTIPALRETFHPDLDRHILRLSSLVKRLEKQEDALLNRFGSTISDSGKGVLAVRHPRDLPEVLREYAAGRFLYAGTGIRPSHARLREAVKYLYGEKKGKMSLPGGKIMDSAGRETYIYNSGYGERPPVPEDPARLTVPGKVVFEEAGVNVSAQYSALDEPDRFPVGNTVLIRRKGLREPLWVRRRRPGDRFHPLGLDGAKKLKDFFIDRRIPLSERDRVPLVLDDEGTIVWVAGVEISRKAALMGYEGEEGVLLRMEKTGIGTKPFNQAQGPGVFKGGAGGGKKTARRNKRT